MSAKKAKGVIDALTDAAAEGRRAARQAQQGMLRTGESKPDSTGTASKTRLNLGQLGAKTKGQAKSLEEKMIALEKLDDKKGEPAQLLRNAINELRRKLPASVVKQVRAKVKTKTTKSEQQLMDEYKKKLVADGKYTEADIKKLDEYGYFNKGGVAKKRTGSMDFRKGGMVLSTVDNRRKK